MKSSEPPPIERATVELPPTTEGCFITVLSRALVPVVSVLLVFEEVEDGAEACLDAAYALLELVDACVVGERAARAIGRLE